ncbi:MAG: EamA family transporter [Chitinivibrionales bacterium]|nr:EamA family transporter [Chitinivibrionales bacterium]
MGGSVASGLSMMIFPSPFIPNLGHLQILVLLYLGLVASGVGFFLWNIGALRVSSGVLAIFNNVKIPLAVLVSLLFFREKADLVRLSIGCAIILYALYLNKKEGPDN